jgi:hypothetical protein
MWKKHVGLKLRFWNRQCHRPRGVEQGGMVTIVHQVRIARVQAHISVSEPRVNENNWSAIMWHMWCQMTLYNHMSKES